VDGSSNQGFLGQRIFGLDGGGNQHEDIYRCESSSCRLHGKESH
jgi:hypothetical protein